MSCLPGSARRRDALAPVFHQMRVEGGQPLVQSAPSVAKPEPVGRRRPEIGRIDRARQEQHAAFLDKRLAECLDPVRAFVAGKRHAGPVRVPPVEQILMARKKRVPFRQVLIHYRAVPGQYPCTVAKGDHRQPLAGARIADRKIVLHPFHLRQYLRITAGDPANAQPRKTVGFRHHIQRKPAFIDIGDERQVLRVRLAEPVEDFVMQDIDAVPSTDIDQRLIPVRRQDRAGRVMRKIDRDKLRIRPDGGGEPVYVE